MEQLGCPLLVERCCCLGHDLPLVAPGEEGWREEEEAKECGCLGWCMGGGGGRGRREGGRETVY